jgi:hypothetical protein
VFAEKLASRSARDEQQRQQQHGLGRRAGGLQLLEQSLSWSSSGTRRLTLIRMTAVGVDELVADSSANGRPGRLLELRGDLGEVADLALDHALGQLIAELDPAPTSRRPPGGSVAKPWTARPRARRPSSAARCSGACRPPAWRRRLLDRAFASEPSDAVDQV